MLTKQVCALLALGGEIRAWRVFPHPYHYGVALAGHETHALSEDDVIALLARKAIEPPPVGDYSDAYGYRLIARDWIAAQALRDFKFGFGRCAVCAAAPIGGTAQGVAARHGFSKADPTPCAGSGRALAQFVAAPMAAERAA